MFDLKKNLLALMYIGIFLIYYVGCIAIKTFFFEKMGIAPGVLIPFIATWITCAYINYRLKKKQNGKDKTSPPEK